MNTNSPKNRLQHEKSLYLQQHAENPIDWFPWSNDAFEKAKDENKLLLISIGYSSCHWCHVMEKEVFEKTDVADLLNRHFVCIKVDREERPDVDNVYMSAVQLMNQNGGWPLNCITLPDGRPVFGGTYFPKEHFIHILQTLVDLQKNDYQKMLEYASSLQDGMCSISVVSSDNTTSFTEEKLHELVQKWASLFDWRNGGNKRAPKFPMPNNYEFLLQYGRYFGEEAVIEFANLTLLEIICGGIYDQIEGGLMRYSVDMYWKEPHFEKMLYDNGQFLSVIAHAHIDNPCLEYEMAMQQTSKWLREKMQTPDHLFKSSIDADSEGEEGKYYVWKQEELQSVLGISYSTVEKFYQINGNGFWKNGNYILLRDASYSKFIESQNWNLSNFQQWLNGINATLLAARNKRVAPVIDGKIIFSWNCLVAIGLIDVAIALKDKKYYEEALLLIKSLENNFMTDNQIYRIADDTNKIHGFLDDYAFYISLCIRLHQYNLENQWLEKATKWLSIIETRFQQEEKLFHYAEKDPLLLHFSIETEDNVIPASNSVLANCYWDLGVIFSNSTWLTQAHEMLQCVHVGMENYGSGYSNWAILLHKILKKDTLVTYLDRISSEEHLEQLRSLHDMVLFSKRIDNNHLQSYEICHNKSCSLPLKKYETIQKNVKELLSKSN